ncbi:MAG: transporter substrate-binding domain-containing protein [Anaerolineae bacterium]|nr:transporter substrate-binding domain-containing protein [Anaerolineae bacterium]
MSLVALSMTACTSSATPASPTVIPAPTATRQPQSAAASSDGAGSQAAESALLAIRDRGTVRVGVLYGYEPFGYLAPDGTIKGYEVELSREIAALWGVEIEFVQVTRQTRLRLLQAGDVDMLAAAVARTRDLEAEVEFSQTTFAGGYSLLVNQSSGFDSPEDLSGQAVGAEDALAFAALQAYQEDNSTQFTATEYAGIEDAVAALASGVVQAVAGRREHLMLAAQEKTDTLILEDAVMPESYAFAVRRGDVALRDLLDLSLQQLNSAGKISPLFTANLYGYSADVFPALPGESELTLATFPVEMAEPGALLERLRTGDPLRVAGLSLSATPAVFDGQPIVDGYNRAVINEMARRWNVSVIEIPDSVENGFDLLAAGQADVVVGVRPSLNLLGVYAVSEPYYARGLRLIYIDDVALRGINDLEFKPSLAIPPIDISRDLIDDNNGFPQIQESESLEDAFEAVTSRGVYGVVGDEYTLYLMAQAEERLKLHPDRYRASGYAMAMSRLDPDFLALVNFTLQDMSADGTLTRLQEQYFKPYLPEGEELEAYELQPWPGDAAGYLQMGY